jgi:hypothetical protein
VLRVMAGRPRRALWPNSRAHVRHGRAAVPAPCPDGRAWTGRRARAHTGVEAAPASHQGTVALAAVGSRAGAARASAGPRVRAASPHADGPAGATPRGLPAPPPGLPVSRPEEATAHAMAAGKGQPIRGPRCAPAARADLAGDRRAARDAMPRPRGRLPAPAAGPLPGKAAGRAEDGAATHRPATGPGHTPPCPHRGRGWPPRQRLGRAAAQAGSVRRREMPPGNGRRRCHGGGGCTSWLPAGAA